MKITPPPFTSGPWKLGEFDEHLGYDCMTGGVWFGVGRLDGSDYGQRLCQPIKPETRKEMEADARLIAAAPDMAAALVNCLPDWDMEYMETPEAHPGKIACEISVGDVRAIIAALQKAGYTIES